MKLEIDIPEHQYNNIIALNSLSLGRMPYKGIIMYAINAIKKAKPLPKWHDLAVDCIDRQALLNATVHKNSIWNKITDSKGENLETIISKLPPVTPQLSSGLEKNSKKLEKDFGESDCISREQALEQLRLGPGINEDVSAEYNDAVNMAIKALEQEPILDKIKAEIEDIAFDWQEIDGEHESFMVVDLNDVLNILDKYKVESEEKK